VQSGRNGYEDVVVCLGQLLLLFVGYCCWRWWRCWILCETDNDEAAVVVVACLPNAAAWVMVTVVVVTACS